MMMINEKLFAWSKKSNGYQRFRICWASQGYKQVILPIAVISLSLLIPRIRPMLRAVPVRPLTPHLGL